MPPSLAAYIYPWDLARGRTDKVLDDLKACGISGLNLAANYHAITALSPRGKHARLFFLPRGAVFFPARRERYGRVQPFVWHDPEVTAAWAAGARSAADQGFTVDAWTIGMFQPWMAQDYPFTARVMVTGDRADTGLCPNSPYVQEYLAQLAVDLADQIPVRRFILEGIGIPEWNYGWVRPRVLADISPLGKALLRLCFCESCIALATGRGIDVAAVKATVLGLLSRFGVQRVGQPPAQEVLAGHYELQAYSLLGSEGAAAVVRAMAAALSDSGAAARLVIPVAGRDPDPNEAPVYDVLGQIAGITIWTAVMPPDVQMSYLPKLRRKAPELAISLVIGPPLAPGAPVNLVTPSFDYTDPAFLHRIRTARALEPTEIAVYHYGLLDDEAFRLTCEAIAAD